MLLPTLVCKLWLIGGGTGTPDRRCPIPSHYIGWCGLGLPFLGGGGVRPPGRTIYFGASLFDVRVIMTVMCVLVMKLLCQAMTG
jgi:hypothetical protein